VPASESLCPINIVNRRGVSKNQPSDYLKILTIKSQLAFKAVSSILSPNTGLAQPLDVFAEARYDMTHVLLKQETDANHPD
jgi:hypothetical protein